MATIFQGLGATTALSPKSNSLDSTKLHVPSSRTSLSGRKVSFFCIRSEGKLSPNPGSNPRARRADQLVANAVATKADSSAASTASKPGYDSFA
ncbi:hypothetical protein TorRG33x02_259700 [Trema orientale]|uniref:Uncharacterized protein n=1 Tax=Trema orientale TaxID=63057 RepID=A0A2P5D757_TREOI|nr:hypothetical protein TorRG33x02_259700 [Trema orientale]